MSQNYKRVVPRDLFNEAKLLKCVGRLSLIIHDGDNPFGLKVEMEPSEEGDYDGFQIKQLQDGNIYISNLKVLNPALNEVLISSSYNSKDNYSLFFGEDATERVLDEDGNLTEEFEQYLRDLEGVVKLKPLSEGPFFSQMYWLFGERHTVRDDDFETFLLQPGATLVHKKSGRRFLLATAEEEIAYKLKKQEEEYAEKERLSHLYDNYPHTIIDLHNPERWKKGLDALKDNWFGSAGAVEMTEDAYDHFLNCLPPVRMEGSAFVAGEPFTHDSDGRSVYLCAVGKNRKYFAQYGTVKMFEERSLFKSFPQTSEL